MYWNEYKTKSENKDTAWEYRYFLESNFVGANRLFVLINSNQDDNAKRYRARIYYLPEIIIKSYVIANRKNFYDQPIDSDKKRCEEIIWGVGDGEVFSSSFYDQEVKIK